MNEVNEYEQRKKLEKQLINAHGKVEYTYTAHHKIEDRMTKNDKIIRTLQIVLTAVSTGGFLATIITNQIVLSWIGGIFAACSLALNLYSKDFKLLSEARLHKDAADELWMIIIQYENLITDINEISIDDIMKKRDALQRETNEVSKKYPGTDRKGYLDTKNALQNEEEQSFGEGEAEKFLP